MSTLRIKPPAPMLGPGVRELIRAAYYGWTRASWAWPDVELAIKNAHSEANRDNAEKPTGVREH
jgi:hypothetical protein